MNRRTSPQSKKDDDAFPVRVKFIVPRAGLGTLADISRAWLNMHLGPDSYAWHSATTLGGDACAVYFREVDDARAFIASNPKLELADATQTAAYSRPVIQREDTDILGVCNLYSMTKGPAAIRELFDNLDDQVGNLEPQPSIYPDAMAPVVANSDEGIVLKKMRWGMPSPQFALKGKNYDRGVTNVRNTKSPHWRRWLGVKNRCVVPFTRFSEPLNRPGKPSEPVWFTLGEDDPLAFFAGIYVPQWTSVRKVKDGETTDDLFAFLTTEANAEVAEVHPKAMPVILETATEVKEWLNSDTATALELQRKLPDGRLLTC